MSGKKRGGYEGASLVCPECSRDARFVERRGKWCESLLGPLRLTRCYYHCRGCGRGYVPWDNALGLGVATLTPAASQVASIAGVQSSFAQSAEVTLQKLCGLRLSESTVERVTEAAGERLATLLHDKVTFDTSAQPWAWQRDARGRSCAYISLDATGVRQQGENGAKAEGRMAYVGMLYNPRSKTRHQAARTSSSAVFSGFLPARRVGHAIATPGRTGRLGRRRATDRAYRTAAMAWRNSSARTSRWQSASSTSGTRPST